MRPVGPAVGKESRVGWGNHTRKLHTKRQPRVEEAEEAEKQKIKGHEEGCRGRRRTRRWTRDIGGVGKGSG